MDDFWKGVGFGLLALAGIHIALDARVRHTAKEQVLRAFDHTGNVHIGVQPRGWLGLLANDLWSLDVYGAGQRSDNLPFYVYPRSGWKGHIRHLRLHYTDFTLNGYPVRRMEADVPFVTYDIGEAIYKNRLVMRGAGIGPALVELNAQDLKVFISKKYHETLSDVSVVFLHNRVILSAKLNLLGGNTLVQADGVLTPREGRYLDLTDAKMSLSGFAINSALSASILSKLNPVLDTEVDLHFHNFFTIGTSEIGEKSVIVRGDVTVPRFTPQSQGSTRP